MQVGFLDNHGVNAVSGLKQYDIALLIWRQPCEVVRVEQMDFTV